MIVDYNKNIIDNIHDLVPAVKIQIAMYEAYGIEGIIAYEETAKYAKSKGLLVIGDIKRGDIGNTATAYASHLTGIKIKEQVINTWTEDMITVNPYLGKDSLEPFKKACESTGKGCFVLVKTSNPGSADIQDLTPTGQEKTIYEIVAEMVSDIGADSIGSMGYSLIGAVVGATHPDIGTKLRKMMPHTFFLVPGYGAQGATAGDIQGFYDRNGRGVIINSSRGIIANWRKDPKYSENNIGDAARDAVLAMKHDIREKL